MLIYVLIGLAALLASTLVVLLLHNARLIIDTVAHWGERKSQQARIHLHRMRYLVVIRKHPIELKVRHTPHPSRPPSPVFDGKYRKPWGW